MRTHRRILIAIAGVGVGTGAGGAIMPSAGHPAVLARDAPHVRILATILAALSCLVLIGGLALRRFGKVRARQEPHFAPLATP